MREDWNRRAAEDAHYYVAFGRRNQSGDEFFDTAREQVAGFEREMRRLAPGRPRARRALEIGCGPGRLLKPMSAFFGEIHGVDVAEEMVTRAGQNLAAIPHAHAHHAPNSDLSAFADESFDFIYSYAVFQHIPSREVVFGYLDESVRVLKPGGLIRCQVNGLPPTAKTYDTWSGVRISAEEVREFARARRLALLALEGVGTQYMWVTLRKRDAGSPLEAPLTMLPRIHRVSNANSSEPAVPLRGRFAALGLWIEGLPEWADLLRLEALIDGSPAFLSYLAHPEPDGLRQLNMHLPEGLASGLKPLLLLLDGQPVAEARVRLVPPGPVVPRIVALSDGIDLLSGTRITTRTVKICFEEVERPEDLRVFVRWPGAAPVPGDEMEYFCTNPRVPSHELNFRMPAGTPAGEVEVVVGLGRRLLGRAAVTIAA